MSAAVIVQHLLEDDFDPKEAALDMIGWETIVQRHGFQIVDKPGEEPTSYKHTRFLGLPLVIGVSPFEAGRNYKDDQVGRINISFWERQPGLSPGLNGWMHGFVVAPATLDHVLTEIDRLLAAHVKVASRGYSYSLDADLHTALEPLVKSLPKKP